MYQVRVKTDGKEYLLHEPRDNEGEYQLIAPKLELEMGKSGSFTFQISPFHPNKDVILPLKSEVSVYDDGELIFRGRPVGNELDFRNLGRVACEGDLAYLIDSIQRPYSITGSGAEFLRKALEVHNSHVPEEKQFKVGNITVADTSPDTLRENDECENTLRTLRSQLVDKNGGYLVVRHVGNDRYLDYVSDYGGINSQVIRFGENMVDFTCTVKPTSIITALIPRGAEIESEDTESDVKRYVDITSVNGGKDYIFDKGAVQAYGWIWGAQTFDDAADPEALLAKARAYLQESIALPETIELTAVDLGLIDADVQKLKLGYWTNVISVPHGINKRFLLSKKTMHLDNPGKDQIVLGKVRKKFTESTNQDQIAISNRIDRVAASTSREINRKVENATQLITGGTGGYVVIDVEDPFTGKKTHPWRLLIMDTPDKDTAKNVIQVNKNGIGFSRTGINGPYTNAWTIDGNFVADFITAGTMLAERIRGGILELGGAGLGRDGSVVVKDANGKLIGSLDKTGIHIMLGEITGGTINIGDGTFRVDSDGSVYMNAGTIDIGNGLFYVDENIIQLGDYIISADGTNELRSENGYVAINSNGAPDGSPGGDYASLHIGGAGYRGTTIDGIGNIECGNISGTKIECFDVDFPNSSWAAGWSLLDMLKDLYDKIDELKSSI